MVTIEDAKELGREKFGEMTPSSRNKLLGVFPADDDAWARVMASGGGTWSYVAKALAGSQSSRDVGDVHMRARKLMHIATWDQRKICGDNLGLVGRYGAPWWIDKNFWESAGGSTLYDICAELQRLIDVDELAGHEELSAYGTEEAQARRETITSLTTIKRSIGKSAWSLICADCGIERNAVLAFLTTSQLEKLKERAAL